MRKLLTILAVSALTASAFGQLRLSSAKLVNMVTAISVPATPNTLTNGIAAYYPFDNDYNDYSGLANHLTATASPSRVTWYIKDQQGGLINQALYDGTGGYAKVADNSTIAMGSDVSFTVSIWVWLNSSGARCLAIKGDFESAGNVTWFLADSGTRFRFAMGNAGGTSTGETDGATSANQYGLNSWFNVCGVYNSATHLMNIYVNGISNAPTAQTGTFHSSSAMAFGANSTGTEHGDCQMDECILWTNRALTFSEVAQVYTNGLLARTPPNFASTSNYRNTVFFNGDARFTTTGPANTNMPNWFFFQPWSSNHNAVVVNESGGIPSPGYPSQPANSPPTCEMTMEWTNSLWTAEVLKYLGAGTNVYFVDQIGINEEILLTNAPLAAYNGTAYWNSTAIAREVTNHLALLTAQGIKCISMTTYDQIGLHTLPGDGTWANAEQVRVDANRRITNGFPNVFAGMDMDALGLITNNSPQYYGSSLSELVDYGDIFVATNLNALLNTKAP